MSLAAVSALSLVLLVSAVATGCGEAESAGQTEHQANSTFDRPVPRFGLGGPYDVPPSTGRSAAGRPVGALECSAQRRRPFGVHLEIFANRLDLVIPAGIGVAPPRRRDGAYVRGGKCWYPIRTIEPTGLIEIERGRQLTLGDFFDVWGRPLSERRLLGFRAKRGKSVDAFVNGHHWNGDPRAIPLRRHAAIVLEVGGYFPPTRVYAFPPGF